MWNHEPLVPIHHWRPFRRSHCVLQAMKNQQGKGRAITSNVSCFKMNQDSWSNSGVGFRFISPNDSDICGQQISIRNHSFYSAHLDSSSECLVLRTRYVRRIDAYFFHFRVVNHRKEDVSARVYWFVSSMDLGRTAMVLCNGYRFDVTSMTRFHVFKAIVSSRCSHVSWF